jgi:alpha-L-fucosidase
VQLLADVVSKNGNLLLNVGPKSDGTIPEPAQQILREIGGWLKVNGEAIYGSRPWRSFGEGPTKVAEGAFHEAEIKYTPQDFRFTTKGETLYAIEMAPPDKTEVVIHSLGLVAGEQRVESVTLLGSSASVSIKQGPDGLNLKLNEPPTGRFAVVYKIQFADH